MEFISITEPFLQSASPVAPLIRIQKWNVASWNGGGVLLECMSEAYPPPVNFWISRTGSIIGDWPNFELDPSLLGPGLQCITNRVFRSYDQTMRCVDVC